MDLMGSPFLIKTSVRVHVCDVDVCFLNKRSIYIPYAYLLSVLTLAVLME